MSKFARQVPLSEARQPSDHSPICLLIYATQNGWKLPIVCEEMGVKYDWALVDFSKNEQKSEAFLKINPNGRIPALIDREADVTVAESSVILEYLATKFQSDLLPSSLQENLHVRQWLAWQVSGLGPMMGQAMAFQRILAVKGQHDELAIGRFKSECGRLLQILNDQIESSGGPFIMGPQVTLADVACFAYAASWFWANTPIDDKPALKRWLDTLHQRESFKVGVTIPFARPAFFGPEFASEEEIQTEIAKNAGQFKIPTK